MHEASYYTFINPGEVRCNLCPHQCRVSMETPGKCGVRFLENGILNAKSFGKLSSIALDPVEKKPLYHFYPGSKILSLGSIGCNFSCKNCQNENISQCELFDLERYEHYSIDSIFKKYTLEEPKLIAFTYNEPVVNYEFAIAVSKEAGKFGIETAMISNGYIMPHPLNEILPLISAFNIDLKAFNNDFYRSICGGTLAPVLRAIDLIKDSGRHLEITYLIIPGLNDDYDEFSRMIRHIVKNYGKSQILHLSRYFPRFQMDLPATSLSIMNGLLNIANEELYYVYPGNTGYEFDSSTYCPVCGNLLIERQHYNSRITGLSFNKCKKCNTQIEGKFENNDQKVSR